MCQGHRGALTFPQEGGIRHKVLGWDVQQREGDSLVAGSGLLQDKPLSMPVPHCGILVVAKGLHPVSSSRSLFKSWLCHLLAVELCEPLSLSLSPVLIFTTRDNNSDSGTELSED